MISFSFKGIQVEAVVAEIRSEYNDPRKGKQYRFLRHTDIWVNFWDYAIRQECFTQLAFIKSVLQCYMQFYWKRSSKQGSKIDLIKEIRQLDFFGVEIALRFTAKQKNSQYSLHISNVKNGQIQREVYCDIQEVMMLHDAITKAFNLLGPNIEPTVEDGHISKLNWGH